MKASTRSWSHPAILVYPARRSGESTWSDSHLPLVLGMTDSLVNEFNIDTNRIQLWGHSDGGGASVKLLERSPNRFASVVLIAGTGATSKPALIKHVPLWAFHSKPTKPMS